MFVCWLCLLLCCGWCVVLLFVFLYECYWLVVVFVGDDGVDFVFDYWCVFVDVVCMYCDYVGCVCCLCQFGMCGRVGFLCGVCDECFVQQDLYMFLWWYWYWDLVLFDRYCLVLFCVDEV